MEVYMTYALYVLGALAALVILSYSNFIVIIGGSQMGLVERKYIGRSLPDDRIIAQKGEVGFQARTIGPGLHFFFPFLFWVTKENFITIEQNCVGIVEAIDGAPLAPGRIFARSVDGHNFYQDGEAFLRNGGQKGPQVDVIPPGTYRINTKLFKISLVENITIRQEDIGLIEAVDGAPLNSNSIFGHSVEGHNMFQDGEMFLKNGGQKGPQRDYLPPGTYRINTALFRVTLQSVTNIPEGSIGIVTATDGQPIDSGRLLAKSVIGHVNYQNGDGFIKNGGQKGPQMDILLPGKYRINNKMFTVVQQQATVIPSGKVGLVTAKDGEPLPPNELIAESCTGHNNYQNASSFLENKGQRGPQLDVLPPGTYYINPLMFTVDIDDAAVVNQGEVAVIISNVGQQPERSAAVGEPNYAGDKPELYVVQRGFRGIQLDVVGPGTYYVNKRAFIPIIVKTTNITIDWDDEQSAGFNPLLVTSKDGFEIKVGVKVVIRVQPEQAPFMVARIGSIENLVKDVIHPLIDSSFRNQASSTEAMAFLQDRHEQQEKALERAKGELEKYHVEVLSVLICQIVLPPALMETQTNKVIAAQQQDMFSQQREAQLKRIDMEKTKAQADKQGDIVSAEISVKVAEQEKIRTITIAEGNSNRVKLEGAGEAEKILQIGKATAEAYTLTRSAIGSESVAMIELMKLVSAGNIKITPDIVAGGDSASLMNVIMSRILAQNNALFPAAAAAKEE
ncbi:MAG: SPFH domain-containing protein [Candidatus Saccharibacteria bacterium]